MNANDRKELSSIISDIEGLLSRLETVRDGERDKYDNMPENMQSGEKGQRQEEIANLLEEACEGLQQSHDQIEESVQ